MSAPEFHVSLNDLVRQADWSLSSFQRDLHDVGSLPDLSVSLAPGRTWADVHFAVRVSGLRWEYSVDGSVVGEMPSDDDLATRSGEASLLLKVWVGKVQFNSHYLDMVSVDFDVEVAALGDRGTFDCLVAFMDWLASVAGGEVRVSPEGASDLTIMAVADSSDRSAELVADRLRLRDLMHSPFGSYRGVVAPLSHIDEANVDTWLTTHPAAAVTAVVSHIHMWDEFRSTDDEAVLAQVAEVIAAQWRESLAAQFPDQCFQVGIAGEPEEYGPTIWVRHPDVQDAS